jgi:zinc transport system substrate-binding protein
MAGFALLVMVAGACGASPAGAAGDKTSVVASFYPLSEAAARVGGDRVEVTNLTPPGVEPHDLELNPDQVSQIADADVVLYLGQGFQPAVQDAVSAVAQGTTVDMLQGTQTLQGVPEPGQTTTGDIVDPHVWLDPVLMQGIVERTERALTQVDPNGASTFKANAAAFNSQIASLDRAYRTGLSSCQRHDIVTSHAAFGYLARQYGLTQQPITGLSPEAEPDPRRLADLVALVEADGTTTIFTETLVSPKVAQTLASEAGVTTAVLDPLEGLTTQEVAAGADYLSVMRRNLSILRKALGCE